MLVVLGAAGMGAAVKFIPRPVVIGFTNGIAVLIASTQIKDFFGLQLRQGARRVPRAHGGASRPTVASLSPPTTGRSVPCALLLIVVVLAAACRACPARSSRSCGGTRHRGASALAVETVGTRFGGIPGGLPSFHVPTFRPDLLLGLALARPHGRAARRHRVAALGGRLGPDDAATSTTRTWSWSRRGWPTSCRRCSAACPPRAPSRAPPPTSAPARRTPVAGIIHARHAAASSCCSPRRSPYHVPLAVLAAILFVVAWNMGEWARDPATAQADQGRHRGVARHVRAHRVRRPDDRGGGGHDPRGAALHPARGRHDHRGTGHRRVRRGLRACTSCRTRTSPTTWPSTASTARSCSARPTRSSRCCTTSTGCRRSSCCGCAT